MSGRLQEETENTPPSELHVSAEPVLDEKDIEEIKEAILEAEYFDSSAMAPLSAASAAAIARLRAYKPPPFSHVWNNLPLSRRAAVLILLFADRRGDLRVVITMRAASLRSYSGHAAFPGGKADTLDETPFEIARREAWEEIGLPHDDSKIPKPFRIEHLCQLPFSLAKTALVVRPCVAFLHSDDKSGSPAGNVGESMIPRLDAKEVAAVFSAPFHNFLKKEDEVRPGEVLPGKGSDWYDGKWIQWHEGRWRLHHFFVPITNQKVAKPQVREGGQAAIAEVLEEEEEAGRLERYKVWGMTGKMLVDCARIAYDEEPEFEYDPQLGNESMIETLFNDGKLRDKSRGEPEMTNDDFIKAKAGANPAKI
ncbi:NUDIX hydrolase domain-like protein [Xylogone sp. PMI_703]|nr:NUDIX hydrolase domain-like protein [Xylogone sp. PMI_703]